MLHAALPFTNATYVSFLSRTAACIIHQISFGFSKALLSGHFRIPHDTFPFALGISAHA
jgi:hypothetical protein